jgi:hypothetical protein
MELEADLVLFLAKARLEKLASFLLAKDIASLAHLRALRKETTPQGLLDAMDAALSDAELQRWQAALKNLS